MKTEIVVRLINAGKLSVDQLIELGNTVKEFDVENAILKHLHLDQMSVEEWTRVANNATKSNYVWTAISELLKEKDKLSVDDLLKLGHASGKNHVVWIAIVKTGKLSVDQLFELFLQATEELVHEAIVSQMYSD